MPEAWNPESRLLRGRVAVVVGAGRGIGEAVAAMFATAGARVVVVDVEKERAVAVSQTISQAGGQAVSVPVDVLAEGGAERIVASAVHEFGSVNIVANVAGGMNAYVPFKPLVEWTTGEWDQIVSLNLRYHFLMARAVLPQMAIAGGGTIVNIASISAIFEQRRLR
jgi:NAD(P)-dependent dehydrogenase (short-subunit alcohol dehydrogenase family)